MVPQEVKNVRQTLPPSDQVRLAVLSLANLVIKSHSAVHAYSL